MTRPRDGGVILVNVLVLVGIAATVVYLLLSVGALAIARSRRFGEAGQALALIQAGEQSAIAALRRDMRDAPQVDHAGEAWGKIAQEPIAIDGGSFALAIADAQDRFNLNALTGDAPEPRQTLHAIVAALNLPEDTAATIADTIARDGPLRQLGDLTVRTGIPPRDVTRLSGLATALPGAAPVNVNTAAPELLTILLTDPAHVRTLVALRKRNGFLTPKALAAEGIALPPDLGFTSDLYRLRTTVRIGDTLQAMESLLQRRKTTDGAPEVEVVMRRNPLASVSSAPPEPAL